MRVAAIVGVSAFLALMLAVVAHPAPFGVDVSVHRWFAMHHVAVGFFRAVTQLGLVPYLLLLVAASVPAGSRDVRRVGTVLAAAAAVVVLRDVLAAAIARPRPPRADWLTAAGGGSFPSGHTAAASVAAAAVILVLVPLRGRGRRLLAAAWVLVAVAVGASRVVLGVHWLTDVLAGWSIGLAVLGIGGLVLRRRSRPVR